MLDFISVNKPDHRLRRLFLIWVHSTARCQWYQCETIAFIVLMLFVHCCGTVGRRSDMEPPRGTSTPPSVPITRPEWAQLHGDVLRSSRMTFRRALTAGGWLESLDVDKLVVRSAHALSVFISVTNLYQSWSWVGFVHGLDWVGSEVFGTVTVCQLINEILWANVWDQSYGLDWMWVSMHVIVMDWVGLVLETWTHVQLWSVSLHRNRQ